jgi:Heavy metal binding domain
LGIRDWGLAAAFAAACAVAVAPAALTARAQAAKPKAPAGDIELPPISYVCTMAGDEDVIEDRAGKCPKCGMTLVPIRLDSVWTCATRPLLVVETKPGKCPVDGTPLVRVTAAVSWTCKDKPTIDALEPGTCPDGAAMIKKYASRAHGNHNPQHGGLFFMAPDNWHHVEGTYLASGVFRLHLYDDYTKPLPLKQLQEVSAVLVARDAKTGKEKEIPLARSGRYLQAPIGKQPFPAQMFAKVKFKAGEHEHRFDFGFDGFSKEPKVVPAATMTGAMPAASPATAPATVAPAPDLSSGVDPALIPVPIPETVPEMLAQLRTRTDQIRTFIDRGAFAAIYVPAFQAKDLALALDEHRAELPDDRQRIAVPAIARLVRTAYLLDAFGDLGNKQQIVEAYNRFTSAVKDIESAFPARP